MKFYALIPLAALFVAAGAGAQTKIWRCGNSYTNSEAQAKAGGCKAMEGGNVSVVEGTRVNGAAASSSGNNGASTRTASSAPRIDSSEQKARDADARTILEAELKKAETRHGELLKEWNNGEPEKQGAESRNYQKYLDRVAELKAALARNENDIAGLKRELGRAGGTVPASK